MTVIAWDGKCLAADKQGTDVGMYHTVTKAFRVGKHLVASCGLLSTGMEMVEWVRRGMREDDFPPRQRDKDDYAATIVVCRRAGDPFVRVFERSPRPLIYEDPFLAMGAGRDYAMAAMALGKNAKQAVELACRFESSCGRGVDVLELV